MGSNQDDLIDSLFPVGQERWIKIRVKDRDICAFTAFRLGKETDGYETTAIGVRDEYVPQISAIGDLEDKVIPLLLQAFGGEETYHYRAIMEAFKEVKNELKEKVIMNAPPRPENNG